MTKRGFSFSWMALGLLLAAGASHCSAQAGQEAPAAYCPVGKPDPVPADLAKTFSKDPKVTRDEKLKELDELANRNKDEPCSTALRWLIHQADEDIQVRDMALRTLGFWSLTYLPDDVVGMIEDAAQPLAWKTICVKHLGELYVTYRNNTAFDGLLAASQGKVPELRDAALIHLGHVAAFLRWRERQKDQYESLSKRVDEALKSDRATAVAAALEAIGLAGMQERATSVEQVAGDEKRPADVRAAALRALATVGRPESLAVIDAALKSDKEEIAKAAQESRPFVLVTRLEKEPTRAEAFAELKKAGAPAKDALMQAMLSPEAPHRGLAKTLLGDLYVGPAGLPVLDRKGMEQHKKEKALFFDKKRRIVAIEGEFKLEQGPLEYAVVCKGENAKLHECILALDCPPMDVFYTLFACEYAPADIVRQRGRIPVRKGSRVQFSVEFERETQTPAGAEKKKVRVPLETLIWDAGTGSPMKRTPWAFTGSRMERLPDGNEVLMVRIEKSIVALMDDPNALMNLPDESAEKANVGQDQSSGYYEVNRAAVPPTGTRCWLVFEPVDDASVAKDTGDGNKTPDAGTDPKNGPKP